MPEEALSTEFSAHFAQPYEYSLNNIYQINILYLSINFPISTKIASNLSNIFENNAELSTLLDISATGAGHPDSGATPNPPMMLSSATTVFDPLARASYDFASFTDYRILPPNPIASPFDLSRPGAPCGSDVMIGSDHDAALGTYGLNAAFSGGPGPDVFTLTSGDDIVDGGPGFDTAIIQASRFWGGIARQDDGSIRTFDRSWHALYHAGTDTLVSIEAIQFDDVTISTLPTFDFDGDFCSDVILRSQSTGAVTLLERDFFVRMPERGTTRTIELGGVDASTQVVGSGDFNHDGFSDLLLRDMATGAVTAWIVRRGAFQDSTLLGGVGGNIDVVEAADFNRDFTSDILLHDRDTGGLSIWTINPDSSFGGSTRIGGIGSSIELVGTGDFFSIGGADILLRDHSNGGVSIWQIENGSYVSSIQVGGVGTSIDVIGAYDFTGDGIADILLHDQASGDVSYWSTDADGNFVASVYIRHIDPNSSIVAVRDVNGDSLNDVVVRNNETGEISTSGWIVLGSASSDFLII